MSILEDWTVAVCTDLGLDHGVLDMKILLDVARDAARGVARPAAPLTTYLVGVAVGQGIPLSEAAARVTALASGWATPESQDTPAGPQGA
jgi:Domain of unknown function (DUF6457)